MRSFGFKNIDLGPLYDGVAPASYPMEGLIHYYKMDSLSGSQLLDIIGSNHITIDEGTVVAGKLGNGWNLATKNASGLLTTAVNIPDITASCWHYYQPNHSNWHTIFCRQAGSYHHVLVQANTNRIGVYSGTFYDTGFTLTPNTWYHIVFAKTGNSHKIYVNGVVRGTWPSIFSNVSYPLRMISNYDTNQTQGATGIIDEVAIWNRELTTEEITQIYNSGNGLTI